MSDKNRDVKYGDCLLKALKAGFAKFVIRTNEKRAIYEGTALSVIQPRNVTEFSFRDLNTNKIHTFKKSEVLDILEVNSMFSPDKVRLALQSGVVILTHLKKNGDVKITNATLNPKYIPDKMMPKGDNDGKKPSKDIITYFSIEDKYWRSTTVENLISVE
jgi:hypothetical protein